MDSRHRGNAFDFLRIAAALAVLVSHSFAFVGLPQPRVPYGETLGGLAVNIFFVISGYLVTASWCRDPSLGRFFYRRGLRILPGLAIATLTAVFFVGWLATTLSTNAYFSNPQTWLYILYTMQFKMSDWLPGVFEQNPHPGINGSLWSLVYEVAMYLVLALLGFMVRRRSNTALGILYGTLTVGAASICAYAEFGGLSQVPVPVLWRLDPIQVGYSIEMLRFLNLMVFFFCGAMLNIFAEWIPLRWSFGFVLCILVLVLPSEPLRHCAAWLAVPYNCVVFAKKSPAVFKSWARFDYSYGIYIYAFPLQQLVVYWFWPSWSYFATLVASVIATLVFAAISWHFVEKPAMRLKPALRPATA